MWRVPVGTQMPVEVEERRSPTQIYAAIATGVTVIPLARADTNGTVWRLRTLATSAINGPTFITFSILNNRIGRRIHTVLIPLVAADFSQLEMAIGVDAITYSTGGAPANTYIVAPLPDLFFTNDYTMQIDILGAVIDVVYTWEEVFV